MNFIQHETEMNFTFGITVSDFNKSLMDETINSIHRQSVKIPQYQIVIIAESGLYSKKDITTKNIEYLESNESCAIKKKNLIIECARHKNIVYIHDHLYLDRDWYKYFRQFGNDWDLCMNAILNTNNKRYKDWVVRDHPNIDPETRQIVKRGGGSTLMPYDYDGKYMHIPKKYFVVKKHVMEKEPYSAEWSPRVIDKYKYVMNEYSKVRLLNFRSLDDSWFHVLNKKKKW